MSASTRETKRIAATQAVPGKSLYRHPSWPEGQLKLLRSEHTMAQNLYEFEFYDEDVNQARAVHAKGKSTTPQAC